MATHYSILAWRIPWTEEPGELYSVQPHRVEHNQTTNTVNNTQKFYFIYVSYYGVRNHDKEVSELTN